MMILVCRWRPPIGGSLLSHPLTIDVAVIVSLSQKVPRAYIVAVKNKISKDEGQRSKLYVIACAFQVQYYEQRRQIIIVLA